MENIVNEHVDRVFDTVTVYHFAQFSCSVLKPLDLALYHVFIELYDNARRQARVDRTATIVSVGNSEMDGFITISASNMEDVCKFSIEIWYHTGIQSIFLNREEVEESIASNNFTEDVLEEERVLLYKCKIHFCTTVVHHTESSSFIASTLTDIFNTLFNTWTVIYPVRSSKYDINIHWVRNVFPYSIQENTVTAPLCYDTSMLTEIEDFGMLYNLEILYQRSIALLHSMSERNYSILTFERGFGISAGRGRFLNINHNLNAIYADNLHTDNFGVSMLFPIGSNKCNFIVRVQIFLVRKPAVLTRSDRARDSYLFREWDENENVQLHLREKRVMTRITVMSPFAYNSQNTVFSSDVEYGFFGTVSRYRQKNQKIAHSLKRLVSVQYADAIYKYVEERLLGPACDIDVLERMIKLLLKDDDDQDNPNKRRKVLDYPYKVDQETLFNWNVVTNNFE